MKQNRSPYERKQNRVKANKGIIMQIKGQLPNVLDNPEENKVL